MSSDPLELSRQSRYRIEWQRDMLALLAAAGWLIAFWIWLAKYGLV